MFHLLIISCALFVPYAQSSKIHDYMTKDEIQNFFGSDEVPEHEIITFHHFVDKRNINELTLKTKINGMDRKYFLKPIDGFLAGTETRVWTVKNNGEKLNFTLQENAMKDALANFYHDEKTRSSISHSMDEDGNSLFNGFIDFDKQVRPLPRNVRSLSMSNVLLSDNNDKTYKKTIGHIIYKKPSSKDLPSSVPRITQKKYVLKAKKGLKESLLGPPQVVYPEILIVMDEMLFSELDKNVGKAVQYLLAFWNGVDLRYRFLKNPQVYLNIAGIILAEEKLSFIQDKVVSDKRMVNDENCLLEFRKFLYNIEEIQFIKDYDIAFFMTKRDLFDKIPDDNAVSGIAATGGACIKYTNEKEIASSAVIEDNNGYDGIMKAAHELAHLLGAPHDEEFAHGIPGSPGAINCSFSDGFMMSYKRLNKNKLYFSTCSKKSMTYYLSRADADCLRNNPADKQLGTPLPRMLPGKYMSLDEQCQKMGHQKASSDNENVCLELWCENKTIIYEGDKIYIKTLLQSFKLPPAEGSPCGVNMYCLDGECVKEI